VIDLDVLTDGEATELLSTRLGAARVAADRETAAELVTLCGRLPLALAIIAARTATRPGTPLAVFTAELRDTEHRLDALDAGESTSDLRAVLSWSCQELGSQATDLLRLLGIHPGPDISLPAAVSLAGISVGHIGAAMRELDTLHLVAEHRPGRYVLHDLVRAYAAEQARVALPAGVRQAAIHRTLDHYLHTARNADATLNPQDQPLDLRAAQDTTAAESFGGYQQAMDWFNAEYQVLLAVIARAAGSGFDTHAWQLPAAFVRYLDRHGHWQDWADVQRTALAAAQRLGDKHAQARIIRAAGGLSLRLGRYEQARENFRQALALYSAVNDLVGQAHAHGDMAMTFAIQNRYREALAHSERALDLARSSGYPQVHAQTLNRVGWHTAHLGDYQRALRCCRQALSLLRNHRDAGTEGCAWDSLGYVHQRLRHHTRATECYERAVGFFREVGSRFEVADTLSKLGEVSHAAGQLASARDAWQRALTIFEDLHHSSAVDIRAKLRDLAPQGPDPSTESECGDQDDGAGDRVRRIVVDGAVMDRS
jgi:tetratricopeptide (TPR) repeat protein